MLLIFQASEAVKMVVVHFAAWAEGSDSWNMARST